MTPHQISKILIKCCKCGAWTKDIKKLVFVIENNEQPVRIVNSRWKAVSASVVRDIGVRQERVHGFIT